MALEGQRVRSYVWALLVADNGVGGVNRLLGGTVSAPGRIYQDLVPQTAALPAITITLVSEVDTLTQAAVRVFGTALVDVRVVGDGASYSPLDPIAERVDTVLQNASGSNGGVAVVELRRTDLRAYVENDTGKPYTHLIQTYRSEAYAAP
jgi:hypothetical protein